MTDLAIGDLVEIGGTLVLLASAIAAATPTDSDNRIVAAAIRVLDALALNWGKRNPRKAAGKTAGRPKPGKGGTMPPAIVLLALLPLLGGCGALQSTPDIAGGIDDARDALRDRAGLLGEADRAALEAAIAAYNDAGIDPVRLDAEQRRYWDLACVTMLVVDPDPVLASDCDLVRRALARATVMAPRPVPRPAG